MNITAIKRNCKARETARIYNIVHGGQWISNGKSAFLVEGLTIPDADALAALFDLSLKQRETWYMSESAGSDPRFRREPVQGEEQVKVVGAQVWGDEVYLAMPSSRGMLWVPFEPVRHIKEDARGYAVRWSESWRPLVAVYNGLLCQVLILPLNDEEQLALQRNARAMAAPLYQWDDPVARAEAEAEALAAAMTEEDGEVDV